ncbi:MAG: helix-turn-helix domain-containing protein [Myxococcota bacterium]
MKKPLMKVAEVAVLDRSDLGDVLEERGREGRMDLRVQRFASGLELMGENGPRTVDGLAIQVSAAGPFLSEILRWSDAQLPSRVPTVLVGTGTEDTDDEAARQILGRDHITWLAAGHTPEELLRWLLTALEVREIRACRRQHDQIAQSLRRARFQLFHGRQLDFQPPDGPPCGPPLPTSVEEVEPLKEARARFERAHIQAVIRDQDSLKDASGALGISYTSLWRRLR